MADESTLKDLPLHDAILHRLELLWEQKVCRLHLAAFATAGQHATAHVLEFTGVAHIQAPHAEPWGPSVFINQAWGSSREGFKIEMQSGM